VTGHGVGNPISQRLADLVIEASGLTCAPIAPISVPSWPPKHPCHVFRNLKSRFAPLNAEPHPERRERTIGDGRKMKCINQKITVLRTTSNKQILFAFQQICEYETIMSNQAKAPLELAADIARTIQRDQATYVAGNDMTDVIYSAGIIVRALDRLSRR
jgi:hypothetical protein